MTATHLAALPDDFSQQNSFEQTTNAPSTPSMAFIDAESLLFRFSDFVDNVSIQIDLSDDAGAPVATDTLTVDSGSDDQFVLFQGFPPFDDGSVRDRCQFVITLTNSDSDTEGTHIGVAVFRHNA